MHTVVQPSSNSRLICPNKPIKEPIGVSEIGKSELYAGYDTGTVQKNKTTLQYIISGIGSFNGTRFTAPAVILIMPNTRSRLSVDRDCNDFSSFFISFSGELTSELLKNAGFNLESEVVPVNNIDRIIRVFDEFTNAENYVGTNDSLFMISCLYRLLSLHTASASSRPTKKLSSYTCTILDYIHRNYAKTLTEKDLASLVNLSTNHMHKVFLADMNTTPINYLNSYRIKRARELLKDTELSISKISESVGISGGDYFCRVFRKYNDSISPTEYRKIVRN